MRIGLVTGDPGHPLLAAVTELLTPEHQVVWLDPGGEGQGPDPVLAASPALSSLADVYLLKARTPRALALAALLEEHGVPVLNSAAATARCQDRVEMAAVARAAGLPFAGTAAVATVGELAAAGEPDGPLVIKSRFSRRHDLVARADGAVRLRELAADWPDEPVVVQEFTANSGWDHKLWVVDGQLFAGLRRSELSPDGRGPTLPLPVGELPESWTGAALRAGEVFGLDVYGVDVLDAGGGAPLIVDINAFPGIRGQAGAPEALAQLALRTAARGRRPDADERGADERGAYAPGTHESGVGENSAGESGAGESGAGESGAGERKVAEVGEK
ncbi:ribosomal protein S6--L-glutamate ligase [Streptomyces sp. 2112.3]|uniref:ATP-grasp domain-containing protein n=1 Tax=Streptomyces sp. 2112.3 TaxID=1881023 RepID=UPI0008968865|nr:alpha-L-glutamate ligase [Streptomyces sp. 2112.3]SEE66298.1 ribosomal protein S6--L-glutamate ligase [Streptomyces sp. 2112.3]